MRGKRFASLSFFLVCALSVSGQKRSITEKDLFSFTWIGDTQLSPDGRSVAFVETTVNAKHEGYETALFLLDLTRPGSEPRRLTNGPRDTQPRWSPDGSTIAFVRALEKEGKPQPGQLYLLPLAGGEPQQLTKGEKGVSNPHWSPSGGAIAFLKGTEIVPKPKDAKAKSDEGAKSDGKKEEKKDEHTSDVRIINKAVYRANGEGYLDANEEDQLYLVTLPKAGQPAADPVQLTAGRFGVDEVLWRPDGKAIYYTSEHADEPYYELSHNEIYGVEVPADEAKGVPASVLVAKLPFDATGLALSHDGARFAFRAEEQPAKPRSHQQPDMFVLDIDPAHLQAASKPARTLTAAYDFEIGGGVGGDNSAPRGGGHSAPHWSADGTHVIDVVGKRGSAVLVSIDAASGAVTELSPEKQAVQGFAISGGTALVLVSTPVNIGDLFTLPLDGSKQQTQVTHVNEALFSQLNLTMPDDIEVAPTANPGRISGQKIEAWVQKPPDFDPAKKYPLILNIHGGPHAAYGWVFDHEFQWMAAKGYVVVYPNPRGSTNYGQQFANVIQHDYPGDDFHDLMDSVDAVIKLGYVDPARQGVTGGSGGGLLTDWTVTHTNRFKAAVAQRDITDWANWWYTADFTLFQPTWFEGTPFDHPEEFRKYSPITYVDKIQTPMMFILGEADYRTPPTAGGEDFFRALKYRHIDTVMVRFPGESHELSRSGQPWHRVERLENIVNWFDKYLDGMKEPQYDVVQAAK